MKNLFSLLAVLLCADYAYHCYAEVLELDEDEEGTSVWKSGQYRDRNEIPLPPSYDEERKHRRAVPDDEGETDVDTLKSDKKKKNFINKVHFAMPFGVDLPIYHVIKSPSKRGKKSRVPQGFTPNALKLSAEYSKLDVQTPDRKSDVAKSWGMTYNGLFQDTPRDITGQMRSKLEGGYKIKEEDLDNGMMFRGLGGLMLRDQNHQIVQSKFAEKEDSDEEKNARSDVAQRRT